MNWINYDNSLIENHRHLKASLIYIHIHAKRLGNEIQKENEKKHKKKHTHTHRDGNSTIREEMQAEKKLDNNHKKKKRKKVEGINFNSKETVP